MATYNRKIAVFNSAKRPVGVFVNELRLAKALGVSNAAVVYACNGRSMTCKKHYLRYLSPHLSIEQALNIDLPTFDKLNGTERPLYPTKEITRKGMKYNKQH